MSVLLTKTWQHDPNRVASTSSVLDAASYLFWYIKSVAKGDTSFQDQSGSAIAGGSVLGKWPCAGSSDAITAGLDGTDRLLTTYTPSKIVRAAAGVAHSWIVLGPQNGFYICLDFVGSQDYTCDMIIAKNAFTGGSTTNRPTATNETSFLANGSSNKQLVQNVAPTTAKVHGRLCTDGNFYVLRSVDGSNRFEFACAFLTLTDTMVEDVHNGWLIADFVSNGSGAFQSTTLAAVGLLTTLGRTFNGSAVPSGNTLVYPANSSGAIIGEYTAQDATNSKFKGFPIYLFTYTPFSWRGRIADWYWCITSDSTFNQGNGWPLAGSPELMKVGHTVVPTNSNPSL